MILFIPSSEIVNAVIRETKFNGCKAKIGGRPDPNVFLGIVASVADSGAINL